MRIVFVMRDMIAALLRLTTLIYGQSCKIELNQFRYAFCPPSVRLPYTNALPQRASCREAFVQGLMGEAKELVHAEGS
jgi:hypothetical protein